MHTRGCFLSLLLTLVASGGLSAQTIERNLSMAADDFTQLRINTGAGDLEVSGVDGNDVRARLELDFPGDWTEEEIQDFIDEYLVFELGSGAAGLVLDSHFDDSNRDDGGPISWWNDHSRFPSTRLQVFVPASLGLDLRDGSGDAWIHDVRGNLDITDGSGSLRIDNAGGDVFVNDGSGDLDVAQVAGNLRIEDGSGDLDVNTVTGNLRIRDGSGSMDVRDIGENARIRDGSGNIDVAQVGGDLEVRDGSGRIDTSGIGGTIDTDD